MLSPNVYHVCITDSVIQNRPEKPATMRIPDFVSRVSRVSRVRTLSKKRDTVIHGYFRNENPRRYRGNRPKSCITPPVIQTCYVIQGVPHADDRAPP